MFTCPDCDAPTKIVNKLCSRCEYEKRNMKIYQCVVCYIGTDNVSGICDTCQIKLEEDSRRDLEDALNLAEEQAYDSMLANETFDNDLDVNDLDISDLALEKYIWDLD